MAKKARNQTTLQGDGDDLSPPTLIFTGYARLPSSASLGEGINSLAVEIEVDPFDRHIVDVGCTCIPRLGEKFLISLLAGRIFPDALDQAIAEVRCRYFSGTQRAIVAAFGDLRHRFEDYQRSQTGSRATKPGEEE